MKFCPNCGTPRQGKFCVACGYAFQSEAVKSSSVEAGTWLEDPADPRQERFWNGTSWTDQVRPKQHATETGAFSKKQLLKKLKYGTGFDKSIHCSNCGKSFGRSEVCSRCD